jgi:hypothetical protein
MAELVDALVSNTCGKPCRFDSGSGYKKPLRNQGLFSFTTYQNFFYFYYMKVSSILLSIILVILSCLPCADGANESIEKNHIAATSHDSHSKDHNGDLCSPFCICNCCGVQILSFTPSLTFNLNPIPAEPIVKPETTYQSSLASQFSGGIWQPPQLA